MKIKVKCLSEKAELPVITDDGRIVFHSAEFKTSSDNSHNMVLTYDTHVSIVIPEGYVGILNAPADIVTRSLTMPNGLITIPAGVEQRIVTYFKLNTNSIPTIFSENEIVAVLTLVKAGEPIHELDIEEYKDEDPILSDSPVVEETEQIEVENTNKTDENE